MNHVFFYIMWMAGCMYVAYLGKTWHHALREEGKPVEAVQCFGQCSAEKHAIHVDVTLTDTTYLNIVADHPFMETVFPDGISFFQQDNESCHTEKIVQEWFEEHKEFQVLTWPPNTPDLNPIEHLWDVLEKQV